jgi:hypothetical protein
VDRINPEIGVPGLFITVFGMLFLVLAAVCSLVATVAANPRKGTVVGFGLLLIGLAVLFVGSLVFVPELIARGAVQALLAAVAAVGGFGLIGVGIGVGLGMVVRVFVSGVIPR